MAILIRPGKRFRKARAGNGAEILKKLEDYLKSASTEPVELLCGFWKDQPMHHIPGIKTGGA